MSQAFHQSSAVLRIGGTKAGRVERIRDRYKLERRSEDREPISGMLCASYSNGTDRFGITHLKLVDRSSGGLGARSRVRIDPGMTVTICPEGSTIPWVGARAVRCQRESDGGFLIGLSMSGLSAA